MIATLLLFALADSVVACSPSRLTASPRDTVELRAFVDPADSVVEYRWSATRGRVAGDGARARWSLRGAGLGVHAANVEAVSARGIIGRCSAQVRLVPPSGSMGGALRARAYLAPGAAEDAGYAMYSYLLLGARPDQRSLPRYRSAIAAYLRFAEDIAGFQEAMRNDRARFNVNYLPVTRRFDEPHADSVLKYYDYATAQMLLQKLPGMHTGGPYLVSVQRHPLSARTSLSGEYVLQDLTTVPDTVIAPWVEHFVTLSSQERFGEGLAMRRFLLNLRTAIGVAAVGLPDVVKSFADWKKMWGTLVEVK